MTKTKKYGAYIDSGVEWVGLIPEGWEVRPLFAIARENCAPNKDGAESNLLSLSYGRIIRKDIAGNEGLLPASFETYQVIGPNDIVLRLTDLQNDKRSLRSAISPERGIITSAYLALVVTAVRPKFLNYLLRAYDLQKVFYSMGGGLRQSMKFSDMKRLPVIFPPESTQRAIIEYLDRETTHIDELIRKQERLIELLAEKRKAIISHAVTKGINPTATMKPTNDPWIGDVPAHWTVPQLGMHSRIGNGSTPNRETPAYWIDGEIPWLNSSHVNRDEISDADQFVTPTAKVECHLPLVKAGSLLIGLTGQGKTRGMASILRLPATINQHLAYVTSDPSVWNSEYLLWFMRSSYDRLRELSDENGSTKGALTCAALKKLSVALPPASEQSEIAEHITAKLSKIEKISKAATRSVALLRERRSAVITAAVTGKIDVRELNARP